MVTMRPSSPAVIWFWRAFYFVFKPRSKSGNGRMLARTGILDAYIETDL